MKSISHKHRQLVTALALSLIVMFTNAQAKEQQSAPFTITTNKDDARHFVIGEKMDIIISVSENIYLHCFYVSGGSILKIYPSHTRGQHGTVRPSLPELPVHISEHLGPMKASEPVGRDTVSCIGSSKPMLYVIPTNISEAPLASALSYDSMNALIEVFRRVAEQPLHMRSIQIDITDPNDLPSSGKSAK